MARRTKRESGNGDDGERQATLDRRYDEFADQDGEYSGPHQVRLGGTPFAGAPFRLYLLSFKSSSREAEYFIHDPARFLAGEVEGIEGLPGRDAALAAKRDRISTFVFNHENTLAARKISAIVTVSSESVSITIYKERE